LRSRGAESLRKSKVLLIEDEKIDALGVGRVLKELYPSVLLEVLTTGEHALDWIGRFRQDGETIALILMDMTLPRLEGLELLPQIRKNPSLVHTPVVVLSGNDSQAAVQNAYRSGACAYIVKRSELAEMKRILGHMFSFWLDGNVLSRADALPA
jgi:CheY-like chemotaxis protein